VIDELARKGVERAVMAYVEGKRPPVHVRPQLDVGFRIVGRSVEIFLVRPAWNRPSDLIEQPVAKATFVGSREVWTVFWQRADLKWHRYGPVPTVGSIDKFLELVEEDPHGCFWG
jgi:hypothetical protein